MTLQDLAETSDEEFEEHAKEQQAPEPEDDAEPDTPAGDGEPEPSPEPEPTGGPEDEKDTQGPQTVPLNTLVEERRARQAAQRQLEELTQQFKELKESLTPTPEGPNADEDPFGYLDSKLDKLGEKIELSAQEQQKQQEAAQAKAFQEQVVVQEREFHEKHPDYYDAMKYLSESHVAELQTRGYSEIDAEEAVQRMAVGLLQDSYQRNLNAAEVAYNLAKHRGYKTPSPAAQEGVEGAGEEQSLSKTDMPNETLKQIAAKQAGSQTLANTGSRPAKDDYDIADINNMSDDEFDKLFGGKEGDKRLKKLMS